MAEKVVLGFSGGVDSAAALLLLQEHGYQVVPVVLDLGGTGSEAFLARSRAAAEGLGVVPEIEPIAEEFSRYVVDYMVSAYQRARDPESLYTL